MSKTKEQNYDVSNCFTNTCISNGTAAKVSAKAVKKVGHGTKKTVKGMMK